MSTGMRALTGVSRVTGSAPAARGLPRTSAIPALERLFFSTQPVLKAAQKATTLTRTVAGVCPATTPAGLVKDPTACIVTPADLAGSSWAKSACCNVGTDIMEKAPVVGVRSVTRAARHAGARSPQTARLVIHISFSCAPRGSVTAPAQSTTTQTNRRRPVRGATQRVTNVTERGYGIACPVCGATTFWEECVPRTVL